MLHTCSALEVTISQPVSLLLVANVDLAASVNQKVCLDAVSVLQASTPMDLQTRSAQHAKLASTKMNEAPLAASHVVEARSLVNRKANYSASNVLLGRMHEMKAQVAALLAKQVDMLAVAACPCAWIVRGVDSPILTV